MRSFTKKIAVMMAAFMVMCACLMGCSGSGGSAAEEENTIPGNYIAKFNVSDMMNEEMSESGVTLTTDMNAEFELVLSEDNTFTFDLDAEGFKDAIIAGFTADADDIMTHLFASLGVDTSDVDSLAEMAGYESYDAFKEDLINEMAESFDDATIEEMKDEAHGEGTYEVNDSTITLTSDDDTGVDELKINEDGTLSTTVDFEGTEYELVFEKQ